MFSRRHVLKQLVALGAIAGFGSLPGARAAFAAGEPGAAARYHMPEESSPQALVWVAFGATSEIWGRHYKEVQATIGRLVQAMVPYTQVNVLCHEDDEALARQLCGERNTHFVHAEMDDIWLRDTGGVFVQDEQGGLGLVDFNFNGWGDKQ
ncbi:agmatine deiminase family protein, partial [Aeromonas caviae]